MMSSCSASRFSNQSTGPAAALPVARTAANHTGYAGLETTARQLSPAPPAATIRSADQLLETHEKPNHRLFPVPISGVQSVFRRLVKGPSNAGLLSHSRSLIIVLVRVPSSFSFLITVV